jgi:hypothetical protein
MPEATGAEATTQTGRETADDWNARFPSAAALSEPWRTREEFVAQLREYGIDATVNDLLYWHRRHVLPYPAKRRVGGTNRAYYPNWTFQLVAELRDRQARGDTLDRIAAHLRWYFALLFEKDLTPKERERLAHEDLTERLEGLVAPLEAAARAVERLRGRRVVGGEVVFKDGTGAVVHTERYALTPYF